MNLLGLLHLNVATVVAIIVSFVIPGCSALLAKAHWPTWVVGLLTLALSTANGFFSEWAQAGSGFNWKAAVGTAIVSYVLAVLAHYGIFKDTTLEARLLSAGSGVRIVDTGPGSTEPVTPPPAPPASPAAPAPSA